MCLFLSQLELWKLDLRASSAHFWLFYGENSGNNNTVVLLHVNPCGSTGFARSATSQPSQRRFENLKPHSLLCLLKTILPWSSWGGLVASLLRSMSKWHFDWHQFLNLTATYNIGTQISLYSMQHITLRLSEHHLSTTELKYIVHAHIQ